MKLPELERHLRHHGCALYREGAAYSADAFGSTVARLLFVVTLDGVASTG
jgi:hypothetical protein